MKTRNNQVIVINAERFPTFDDTKNISTEHPVDAAIRKLREAFLMDECDRLETQLHELALDVVARRPSMMDKSAAILRDPEPVAA